MALIDEFSGPDGIKWRMKGDLKPPRKREPEKPCAICKGIAGPYPCGHCAGSGVEP